MKKTVYTIICSFLAVIVLTLSFSCSVLASSSTTVKVTHDSEYTSTFSDSFNVIYKPGNSSNQVTTASGTIGCSLSFPDGAFFSSNAAFTSLSFNRFALRGLFNISVSLSSSSSTSYNLANVSIRNAYFVFSGHKFLMRDLGNGVFILNISDDYTPPIYSGTACFIQLECDYIVSTSYKGSNASLDTYFSSLYVFNASASTSYKSNTWGNSYTWTFYSDNYATSSDISNQTNSINNNITQQTETMTNGFDNSSMTSDNSRLNNQIAKYDAAQQSATNTSVNNIDAADFVNPSSNASIFAAMTFSASFLQSLYNNIGDFGIVVMVSLSLCLGLMLVGWFKFRKGG